MGHLRKLSAGVVVAGLVLSLVACSSSEESAKQEEAKQQAQQQGMKAKKELKEKISKLESMYDDYTAEKGYMEADNFGGFKEEYNLLAKSIKSLNSIEMNDDQISAHLKDLKSEVNSLTGNQAVKAENRYGSPKDVYEVVLADSFHYLLQYANTDDWQNSLRSFSSKHPEVEDVSDLEEINNDATEAIESLQGTPMHTAKELKDKLKKYESNFSVEEYNELNLAVLNFSSSLESQVGVLNKMKTYYIDDGSTAKEDMADAITYFADAKEKISNFESELGLEY